MSTSQTARGGQSILNGQSTLTGYDVLGAHRGLVQPAMRAAVDNLPESMSRIAGYHLGWWDPSGRPETADGGKALRPSLVLAAARAVGGDPIRALPAAVAVELVHNFSLLHDDVMDGDATRRHRPTAWTVFGTNATILAGNALMALALDVLSHDPKSTQVLAAAVQELLDGQSADLSFERRSDVDLAECRQMALAKTGALLGCACALGGRYGDGNPTQIARLTAFGRGLGLAFQFIDDLLGIWGDPAVTGKPVACDLRSRKKSLPVVAALVSGTAAGDQLAEIYHGERAMTDAELMTAAELIDLAGGREYSQFQADALFDEAMRDLSAAAGPGGEPGELAALARLVTRRDH